MKTSWSQLNDCVGKNKLWGERKCLPKYKYAIYSRVSTHYQSCENKDCSTYRDYGALGCTFRHVPLSVYYDHLKSLNRGTIVTKFGDVIITYSFSDFKNDPDRFVIDKDILGDLKGVKEFAPDNLLFIEKEDNLRYNSKCNPHTIKIASSYVTKETRDKVSKALANKCLVVYPDRVMVFPSQVKASTYIGVGSGSITQWIQGVRTPPTKYGILRVERL